MANQYAPDQWIVVEFTQDGQTIRKVLSGWWGGYLASDSWRLSSGITDIEIKGDYYIIRNESGSVYTCHKNSYGVTGLSGSVLANWQEQARDREDVTVTVIDLEQILVGMLKSNI